MAFNYNDGLDDQLIPDGSASFVGGVDEQADPTELKPEQLARCINVQITRDGVQTRKGSTDIGNGAIAAGRVQGMGELDTSSTEKILAAVNGAMYQHSSGTWSSAAGFTPTSATAQVEIVQGNNKLYVCDGASNMRSWDGTTFTDLGTSSPNPPIAKFITWFTHRLFAVKDNDDTVYVSAILNADAGGWDWTNRSFRVGGGEGDAITCISGWLGFNLLVFKNNSFYVVNADPSANVVDWPIKPVSNRVGCVAHRSGKMVGNDFFFLARDGVRSVRQTETNLEALVSEPLSWPIQPLIDRINWSAAHLSNAEYIDNKYILWVPLDSATTPDTALVYDTRLKSWLGYWTGWKSMVQMVSKLNNEIRLLYGTSDGKVYRWDYNADNDLEGTFDDASTAIATTIVTRGHIHRDLLAPKAGWCVELGFNKSLANVSFYGIIDQDEVDQPIIDTESGSNTFSTQGETNALPLSLPFDLAVITIHKKTLDLASLGEYRELQFKLTSSSSKLCLKYLVASAYLNPMKYEQ